MGFFQWFNDQVLRMQWLHDAVTRLVEGPLGLSLQDKVGASVHFFIYDTIKLFLLLGVLVFIISWVQSYFPPERTRQALGGRRGLGANLIAALLGTITPFCSCSSIPLFIGFTGAGLPVGVTFSFLISSPLVDLASLVLLAGIFNWKVALAYVAVGVLLAVIGGVLIDRLRMERYLEPLANAGAGAGSVDWPQLTRRERGAYALNQTREVVSKVWVYVLIGVGVGAAIHNWVPQDFLDAFLGANNWWSVPAATLIGIPLYADVFGMLPVAEALVARGVGLGTALALMMSVTALSLPSLILLRRVVQLPLLALFTGIIAFGILLIGYLVVDGKVVSTGKLLTPAEIRVFLGN
jgi:uncharacterized membrane protein YraQ (UPF0718 family)